MNRTAYISETEAGTIMIRIIPDNSNLARYQQWLEVSKVVIAPGTKTETPPMESGVKGG